MTSRPRSASSPRREWTPHRSSPGSKRWTTAARPVSYTHRLAIGYIGDKLYWAASPYSKNAINSYMFLLFSTPQASSSSYLREYVGSRSYSAISMVPLKQASAAANAAPAQTQSIEVDGQRFTTYLLSEDLLPTTIRPAAKAQAPASAGDARKQAAGKTLRTGLELHRL